MTHGLALPSGAKTQSSGAFSTMTAPGASTGYGGAAGGSMPRAMSSRRTPSPLPSS
jgi:hypothetical protein